MSKTTPATKALQKLGVKFALQTYVCDSDAESIGLQAAEALGVEPFRMLKTLMAEVDGKPVCVVVPSDGEVSMKKLAGARCVSSIRKMRGTPTRGPYSPRDSGCAESCPERRKPVSASMSNDSATATRAPLGHGFGVRSRPARTWFTVARIFG